MSAEARQWLAYARENRQVAALSWDSGLFNPSLQNAQHGEWGCPSARRR